MNPTTVAAAAVAIVTGLVILGRAFGRRPAPAPPSPPAPTPAEPVAPTLPGGWVHAQVTPALQAKAVEILHSSTDVDVGTLIPFVHEGEQFAGFVTWHGRKRAVEIVRPG